MNPSNSNTFLATESQRTRSNTTPTPKRTYRLSTIVETKPNDVRVEAQHLEIAKEPQMEDTRGKWRDKPVAEAKAGGAPVVSRGLRAMESRGIKSFSFGHLTASPTPKTATRADQSDTQSGPKALVRRATVSVATTATASALAEENNNNHQSRIASQNSSTSLQSQSNPSHLNDSRPQYPLTALSRKFSGRIIKPRPRPVESKPSPGSLRLASRPFSISALETVLRSTNAQYRLALMLALPWKSAAFWTVTGSSLGCFYVARLLLPRLRVYAVVLGRGLASLLAATNGLSLFHPYQPSEQGVLQQVWLTVLTITSSSLSLQDSSLQTLSSVALGTSTPPQTPRRSLPRTPDRFYSASPGSDWSPMAMETLPESFVRITPINLNSPQRGRPANFDRFASKRLSLNVPVYPPNTATRPPSWHASPLLSPLIASPTQGNFLTLLAGQERRVLELKEDLRRAEEELERLKKHWAKHEVQRKSLEARRGTPLKPLKTNLVAGSEPSSVVDVPVEVDRRKLLASESRQSNRRVFSSSRHARTLSLLSPDKGFDPQSFTDSPFKRPRAIERTMTMPDTSNLSKEDIFADLTGVPKDAILRTGKQMVGDIKDGFWTFVEDIRQATVGNEAVNGPASARMTPSRQSLGRSKSQRLPIAHDKRHRHSAISTQPKTLHTMTYDTMSPDGASFWQENGVESPESTKSTKSAKTRSSVQLANSPPRDLDLQESPDRKEAEAWDMWGTPVRLSKARSSTSSQSSSTRSRRSSSPLSTASDFESQKPVQSTGPSSPITNTTLSTPDMANIDGADQAWQNQLVKIVDSETIKRTAVALIPDWDRAVASATDASKVEKQD
jgi:hypothetical protein